MTTQTSLKQSVRSLGKILGQTIQTHLGKSWLDKIEQIRLDGRSASTGDEQAQQRLKTLFTELNNQDLLTVARAFAQFLNLANIAEQEFIGNHSESSSVIEVLQKLQKAKIAPNRIRQTLEQMHVDLVLTAHPTEVKRRTLIHKHSQLTECLASIHRHNLSTTERSAIEERIADLISQAWHTEEIRSIRPTPVDEARWGFSVIENSLWQAVPDFIRQLDQQCQQQAEINLPIAASPIRFSSWMGGDRDGNPFVTAELTQQVLLRARRRAARLFEQDFELLKTELSMVECNHALRQQVGDAREPYRALLKPLLARLKATRLGISEALDNNNAATKNWINHQDELLQPLLLCYQSLIDCGMQIIAKGKLLDSIRRVHCFGIHLLKLDIRQGADRHEAVFGELTRYLGLGDYSQWQEEEKQAFLLRELGSKRPLFPRNWQPSQEVKEVLDTCQIIANNPQAGFGIYVISMASQPSDVLCVQLLLQEMGVDWPMPVAPLFETLNDLNQAEASVRALLSIDWYRGYIQGKQYVMIGYSDSAKDAGALAAGWAQFQSQEALVAVCREYSTELTLFHGRGGTIGRGGLPAQAAIYSQPAGSLDGGFRVTEQGETIRYKFGMPQLAVRSLSIYAAAILNAKLLPPPTPKPEWRECIQHMADQACKNYRNVIRQSDDFVPYFRAATPEQELGKLPLGSRPSKRNPTGGIESLRAIPWIFAWAQTRMVLPSWLGVMKAVQSSIEDGKQNIIEEMLKHWPFFHSRLSMLDMVFSKVDPRISAEYDQRLVPAELQHFGHQLREELEQSIDLLLDILRQENIMDAEPEGKESMAIRADYLQPLHLLQVELLARSRANSQDDEHTDSTLERAMMVTIAGIAIGMRNTG